MILIALLIGALLVGSILTFIALGISSPIPWLFLLAIVGIAVASHLREKKQYVRWKDEYSVGIDLIDKDHQKLLNLINQFQTAVDYRTGAEFEKEALDALLAYTQFHFDREEALMEEHGYPDFEAHKEEHRKMIKQVHDCIKQHEDSSHQSMQYGADFLRNWLVNHINGTDQEYSQFLRDKGVH